MSYSFTAFSPDSTQLAVVDDTGTVFVHRVADGARLHVLGAGERNARYVAYTPDGQFLVQGRRDRETTVLVHWPLDRADRRRDIVAPAPLYQLAYTKDGARLVADTNDRVLVIESASLTPLAELVQLDDPEVSSIGPIALAPTGDRAATAVEHATGSMVEAFSVDRPELAWRVASARSAVLALAFSPDGRDLVVARHGTIEVLDAQNGARIRGFLDEPSGSTFALAFSGNGHHLAAGHRGGLAIWRYDDASCSRFEYIAEQKPEVYSVALAPDGRWFAAATARVVTVFEVPGGRPGMCGVLATESEPARASACVAGCTRAAAAAIRWRREARGRGDDGHDHE